MSGAFLVVLHNAMRCTNVSENRLKAFNAVVAKISRVALTGNIFALNRLNLFEINSICRFLLSTKFLDAANAFFKSFISFFIFWEWSNSFCTLRCNLLPLLFHPSHIGPSLFVMDTHTADLQPQNTNLCANTGLAAVAPFWSGNKTFNNFLEQVF